jgi:hypothetical protein
MKFFSPVMLAALNLVIAGGVLVAARGWFTPRVTPSFAGRSDSTSPTAEASTPRPESNITYYLVGTPSQAELLRNMDPRGAVFLVRSPADEAYADSIISDDSLQLTAVGGPALLVLDLRLDSPPKLRPDQIIESQVPAQLPGAPYEPASGDGVTCYIVDSSAQAAVLDATLQKLGKDHANARTPVSRYVIAVATSPETSRFLGALGESALSPGGVTYRVVNLPSKTESGESEP